MSLTSIPWNDIVIEALNREDWVEIEIIYSLMANYPETFQAIFCNDFLDTSLMLLSKSEVPSIQAVVFEAFCNHEGFTPSKLQITDYLALIDEGIAPVSVLLGNILSNLTSRAGFNTFFDAARAVVSEETLANYLADLSTDDNDKALMEKALDESFAKPVKQKVNIRQRTFWISALLICIHPKVREFSSVSSISFGGLTPPSAMLVLCTITDSVLFDMVKDQVINESERDAFVKLRTALQDDQTVANGDSICISKELATELWSKVFGNKDLFDVIFAINLD